MGKIMSKEQDARNVALNEYDKFMDKYKAGVEAGNMKLMQHMLRLEADKIRTQSIVDAIEKSKAGIDETVYGDSKMKMQMSEDEYNIDQGTRKVDKKVLERERAFIKMATKPISIGDPDKMDGFSLDTSPSAADDLIAQATKKYVDASKSMGQIAQESPKKEIIKPLVTVDPKTGKKTYNGPPLKSRRVVDGRSWNSSHPNFNDTGVGGM